MNAAIGIDVGGTRTKAGLVCLETGRLLHRLIFPTEKNDENIFLENIASAINELRIHAKQFDAGIIGVGIGVSGFVDSEGVVDSTYGFINFMEAYPLSAIIETRFAIQCRTSNDASLIALGEATFGKGRGFKRVLVLTLGTGLGIGFTTTSGFYDDLPYIHMAGHITVTSNDHLCYCGKRGCLESLVSAAGILHAAQKRKWTHVLNNRLTPEIIFDEAKKGNQLAHEIILEVVEYLRIGISNYTNVFAPDIIILGGGIANGLEPYLSNNYDNKQLKPFSNYMMKLVFSSLKEDAGILGAAVLFQTATQSRHE
jgi:glucokinase